MSDVKPGMIEFYMAVAQEAAKLSRAERLKVGSVIVKGDNIISFGFNGTPPGWDNCCEFIDLNGNLKTKPEVIHSEMNSILKAAKSNESCKDGILFITHSPCSECAKMILGAGIKTVYYKNDYKSDDGVRILQTGGVAVIQF